MGIQLSFKIEKTPGLDTRRSLVSCLVLCSTVNAVFVSLRRLLVLLGEARVFENVQRECCKFFVIDDESHNVLVRTLELQTLHVQDHVHGCGVKTLDDRHKVDFGLHRRNNGMSNNVFNREAKLVCACFGTLVAQP